MDVIVEKELLEVANKREVAAERQRLAKKDIARKPVQKGFMWEANAQVAGRVAMKETRYSRVREFPVVDYQEEQNPALRTDFRHTIYWNPAVVTDKNGKRLVYRSTILMQLRSLE